VRRIIAGIAGLGLVAGAGSVAYNHHGATVRIRGSNGQVQNVHINFSGRKMSCPSGEHNKLNPLVIQIGRIKLTLKGVEAKLRGIVAKYPTRKQFAHAPLPVLERFKADIKQGKRLESAFNSSVHRYNSVLDADCSPASG
jgi:hypothetical protein